MSNFNSLHFDFEKLSEGVYAAIDKEGGAANSNAGIIDLGDSTLVFDTFNSPSAAQDLRKAAEHHIGHPVKYVVNSHFHGDHIRGNQVFPEATIFSTTKTFEPIKTGERNRLKKEKIDLENKKSEDEKWLDTRKQEIDETTDPAERAALNSKYLIDVDLPIIEICLPQVTFETKCVFEGTKRRAEILSFGGGHTESDASLFLPGEGILFLADLLFVGRDPFVGDGDPYNWLTHLEKLEALDFKIAVPGHGPVSKKVQLSLMKDYISTR